MKKKLKLSVVDLMQRAISPKGTPYANTKVHIPTCSTPQSNSIRFEDMYKQAIGESKKIVPLKENKVREVKKINPVNSNRSKKEPFSKTANTRSSIGTSLVNSRKKSISSIASQQNFDNNKENLRDFLNTNEKSEEKIKINPNMMEGKIENTLDRFLKCLESLNHCNHSHIREKNECFLSEREVDSIMWQMGYNIRHSKYIEFLALLEVDAYGGAPSENLCKVLQSLEEKDGPFLSKIKILPKIKIIDSNLEICISDEEGKMIRNYFSGFRETNTLFSKKGKPIGKNKEKFFSYKSSPKYTSFLSPNKNLTNIPSSERLSGFSDSEKKKIDLKETVKVNEFHTIEESSNSSTLCKIESVELREQENNFSQQPPGDQTSHEEDYSDLMELKNKLDIALKTEYKSIDYESENFDPRPCTYQNPYKYVNKPILSIDVNLGEGLCEKIIVYEGESAKEVSDRLAENFAITEETKMKFFKLLESHLSTMLWKIDELSEEMITDRDIE